MDFLKNELLNNNLSLWLAALILIIAILLVAQIIRVILNRRIDHQTEKKNYGIVAFLTILTGQTKPYFVIILAIYYSSMLLDLPDRVDEILWMLLITVSLVQVGFWGTNLINFWVNRRIQQEMERNNTSVTTLSGLGLIVRIIFWGILFLLILENVTGIEITTLVASLGITGIAVALAVQNILSDLFASLSITLDQPFVIGDTILVGEFVGKVEHIGLKSTRVRSLTGEQLIFSNSDLLSSRIRNYKRMERRRIAFVLDVTYDTPADKLERIPLMIKEIITSQPDVTFDRAHFKEFSDSSLRFEIVFFNEKPDYMFYMDTQQMINLAIVRAFAAEEIEFAFPTQTLYVSELGLNGAKINGQSKVSS